MELPLPPSPNELAQLDAIETDVTAKPVADIVLMNAPKNERVFVECKAQSFGPAENNRKTRQASGFLYAAGNVRRRMAVAGDARGIVCYLVPEEQAELMADCLGVIRTRLEAAGLSPLGGATVLGLAVSQSGTVLSPAAVNNDNDSTLLNGPSQVLRGTGDPAILYIIPWIPDLDEDEPERRAFAAKLKTRLIGRIQNAPPGNSTIELIDLLDDISHGVYLTWRGKNELAQIVRASRGVVSRLVEGSTHATVSGDKVQLQLTGADEKESLIEVIRGRGPGSAEGHQAALQDQSED